MRISRYSFWLAGAGLLFTSVFWLGCTGGGGGGSSSASSGGSGSQVFQGVIGGFGSVIVNGVHFDVSNSQVDLNGNAGAENDLQVGMPVTIQGRVNSDGITGTASIIRFEDEVEGPIDAIDLANLTLTVLGQQVITDDTTVISGGIFTDLAVGNIVEVSGYRDANGAVHATRVERKRVAFVNGQRLELKGIVQNYNLAGTTFKLNGLTVNFAGAAVTGILADGIQVEVHSNAAPVGNTLIATVVKVRSENEHRLSEGTEAELNGIVTAFTSAASFRVNGHPVTTNNTTRFEHGVPADLAIGKRVEVDGQTGANGVLAATKVSFHSQVDTKSEGVVSSVDPARKTLGLLSDRITYHVNARTQFEDRNVNSIRQFSLDNLNVGDIVEVRGSVQNNVLRASRIERKNPNDRNGDGQRDGDAGTHEHDQRVEFKGLVQSFDAQLQTLVVQGVTIRVNAQTRFEGPHDQVLTAAQFFGQLRVNGTRIESKGPLQNDGSQLATKIELK